MERRLSARATLFALLLAGCGRAGAATPAAGAEPPVPVEIAPVQLATIRDSSEYVATLKSRRSVTLRPQIDGQVAKILVKSGAAVRRGALLMQIDPSRQFHTVSSQKANAVSKQAALEYAKQEYQRVAALFKGGAASQQELDFARSSLDSATAELEALGALVRESEVQLRYFSILAPEDGVVGDIPVREGDYVSPQTKLTTVDQNQQLELYVSVPVERSGDLRPGMLVQLLDDQGRAVADCHVGFISPQVDEDTQSVLLKAIVDNLHGELRTAQFIRARVVWSERQGPVLPFAAVKRFNGQAFAYAALPKGGGLVAEQRPVTLGPLDGSFYPVLRGLAAGDRVVVAGAQKLHDGSPIAPAPKG
ncbi:MAG: efflux RND transporter periplasmic adaptor subunit [Myxococcales bacterium]